jgi:hypothetical protein
MELLSCGGTSKADTTCCASTRPSACKVLHISVRNCLPPKAASNCASAVSSGKSGLREGWDIAVVQAHAEAM